MDKQQEYLDAYEKKLRQGYQFFTSEGTPLLTVKEIEYHVFTLKQVVVMLGLLYDHEAVKLYGNENAVPATMIQSFKEVSQHFPVTLDGLVPMVNLIGSKLWN